jgi:DNA damage-binding protein 1
VNETHLFQINDQGPNTTIRRVECAPYNGLVTKKPTLAFSNFYKRQDGKYVDSSLVVQVVPSGAFLLEWDATMGNYMERATWKVENTALYNAKPLEIVAANVNGSQVALALSGGIRALLCIQNNAIEFRELLRRYVVLLTSWALFHIDLSADCWNSEPTEIAEISAISCVPLNPGKHASKFIIAAYWRSNIVEIFSLSENGLKSESKTPPLPAIVRSVLLFNFGNDVSSKGADHHAFLLAGLGDGSVASMLWKDNELKDLVVVSLGHAPVSLTPFEVDDNRTVLAAGNRATVFFYDSKKNRLSNSPIMLKVGIFLCFFSKLSTV